MRSQALLALLLVAGCGSGEPRPDEKPPAAETPRPAPAPEKPPETPRPGPAPPPTAAKAADDRAAQKAWEQGRIALVVDLIIKAKSFERGFEAALIFLPDMREGVSAALLEQASSLDGRARERSLEALGSMARLRLLPDALRPRAVETVAARVRTETSVGAWSAAVLALGALAGVDAGPDVTVALSRAVDEDADLVVRSCAEVLGDLDYRPAAPALVAASNRARDRYAVRRILRALGKIGGPEAIERLKRALASADAEDRETAASALGDAGGDAAASALRAAILRPDETPPVRRAAIAALERMGGQDAIVALQACLNELQGRREESWIVIARDVSGTLERVRRR